ncbi:MAG: hypothetical protein NT154_47525, partial [Verrucomicrobia bacterium]|nr:hypothetical protein [Verrucomicrobiota bacterium]
MSRLQPGASFYNDRFRIRSLLREDALSLSWLVEDVVNKRKRCVLREYYPEDPSSTALKRQFSQAAKHLAQMSAGPLVPVVFHFTKDNWFYTLEEFIEGQSLRGIVQANGPFSEKQADIAFEGLLKALRTLANLDPPVFHGALDASQALVCQGDYGLLLAGATYLGQAAQSGGTGAIVPVTWERDLSAAARVAVELLTAKTETEQ